MMADVELSRGFPLFYRNADANTYGVLNVREAFAAEHPEIVAAGARGLRARPRSGRWRTRPSCAQILADGREAARAGGRQAARARPSSSHPQPGEAAARHHPGRRPGAAGARASSSPTSTSPPRSTPCSSRASPPRSSPAPVSAALERPARRRRGRRRVARRRRRRAACSRHPLAASACSCRWPWPSLWEIAARPGWIEARLLPPPSTVAETLARAVARPASSRGHLAATLVARGGGLRARPRARDRAGCPHRLLDPRPPAARPDPAGAARDPLDRLGAAVHPLVRDLRGLEGGADRDRRLLPGLSAR